MRRQLLAAVLAALLFAPVGEAWTWPVTGAVLQPFVFDPAHPYAAGQHRGLDLGGDPGAAVLAPADGSVTFAGTVPSSGKSVSITTADGYAVTLTHLGSITVAAGAAVAEGAVVGTIGPSGDPEVPDPYVHLGIRIAAEAQGYLDPLTFLPARVPAPAALVPPVAVEAPPAPLPVADPAPAPVADPAPVTEPAADAPPAPVVEPVPPAGSGPEPVTVGSDPPAAEPSAAAPAADPAPDAAPVAVPAAAAEAPAAAAEQAPPLAAEPLPAAPPVVRADEDQPVRGGAGMPVRESAVPPSGDDATAADTPRHGWWTAPPVRSHRAFAQRGKRALAPRAVPGPAATDAQGRTHAAARVLAAPSAPAAVSAIRLQPRRAGLVVPGLAAGAVLAAALLTGALGAVRMMVRCGERKEEDPGRPGVALCGGSPSPRSRGGLRRPFGRVRPLSPARRERRPHGEWHGRARHAGDGGRRQGGQVLR
jgi:hypothetical protein